MRTNEPASIEWVDYFLLATNVRFGAVENALDRLVESGEATVVIGVG
jgi:hypothetical protein